MVAAMELPWTLENARAHVDASGTDADAPKNASQRTLSW
jgi:hypothetical protein